MKVFTERLLFFAMTALVGPSIVLGADLAGTWKWSLPSSGSVSVEVTLVIERGEGPYAAVYTETGKDPMPVTVRLSGDSVSFTVERSSLGEVQYLGRYEEDTIDGLITLVRRGDEMGEGLPWRATRVLADTPISAP